MASVEVSNGITIEYDLRGEGEPILFVMGLGGQLIDWPEEFVDLFVARGYQVIRFDNRDSGLSSQADWEPPTMRKSMMSMLSRRPLRGVDYTVEDMAVDAAQLLGVLNIDSAHVVGISMGGMIAQAMAVNHPNKVRSLCSIASKPGDRRSGGIAMSLIRQLRKRPEPTIENAVDESVRMFRAISGDHFDAERHRLNATAAVQRSFTPTGTARQAAAIGASPDRTKRLAQITVPTLVVHGMKDPLVKPSGGIATARAIPSSRLLMLPDTGHDLPRPRWQELCDAIVANIERTHILTATS
ncbi:MAG: alpha/beta hydrolase [Acidimicrobiaceae bacterium]|nr:alpha/beta hydrolase [Acidimicrobiaceae bacterium]MXW62943.1 alpha/beta hydrolase [Acidimicrobiaceae bacterium]MXW76989.1 alpha/beta hydrolase [Acidimicrobiaceae bacterium]MYA74287.1 alpha/beta hydrolase [Acidimicrobiaceae bacterium]MYC41649.1 alpha/beta hydrolase [Acidimicrobiaceae bacterium]